MEAELFDRALTSTATARFNVATVEREPEKERVCERARGRGTVWERESDCVCAGETKRLCVRARERERERLCVCVRERDCVREREILCVYGVCERETVCDR